MLDVETLGAALKLAKKGGGGGGEGGAVIDDSKISSSTTWSSQKIVDTLCPPFTASGPVVQCTPLANSPLDVKVEITPTQEGTGDPSPENVRPIVGWDSVNVTRCGKNLFDISTIITNSEIKNNGDSLTVNTSLVSIRCATSESLEDICHNIPANVLYNFNANTTSNLKQAYFNSGVLWKFKTSQNLDDPTKKSPIYFYGNSINETGTISNIQLELGSTATAYEPYQGNTYTIQLGQTIYGGTLNVGSGTLTVTWIEKNVPNKNPILINSYETYSDYGWGFNDKALGYKNVLSSAFKTATSLNVGYSNYVVGRHNNTFISFGVPSQYASSPEQAGDYIRQYSPKVVYELATPEVIQLTPQQIFALSGTNTIYADAGAVTVSGLSDTVETFNALENRIAALEEAAISG